MSKRRNARLLALAILPSFCLMGALSCSEPKKPQPSSTVTQSNQPLPATKTVPVPPAPREETPETAAKPSAPKTKPTMYPPELFPGDRLLPIAVGKLPVDTAHFRIDIIFDAAEMTIVPNIPFTAQNAPQYFFKTYWQDYERYGHEALSWLENNNLGKKVRQKYHIKIQWWGQEWWPKGAKSPETTFVPPPPVLEWSADDPVWTNQAHFRVEPPDRRQAKQYDFVVTICATFNAGVNGPPIAEQKRRYEQELREYTKEAIAHLEKNNVDIRKSRILWLPEDAQL